MFHMKLLKYKHSVVTFMVLSSVTLVKVKADFSLILTDLNKSDLTVHYTALQ